MIYNKMIIPAIALTLLNTGCVKPTEEINSPKTPAINSNETSVYNEQPSSVAYDDSSASQEPIIYSDPTSTSSDTIYSSSTVTPSIEGGVTDTITNTPSITTTTATTTTTTPNPSDHYQPPQGGYSSSSSSSGNGAYNDPYSSGGGYSSGSYNSGGDYGSGSYSAIDDPYSNPSSSSSSSSNRYSTNIPYSSNNTPSYNSSSSSRTSNNSGIGLQVAALRSYASAEEFRRNLSISPKYHSYIKRGAINKVIITGFSSRSEAKALANRQFPGAFIVSASSNSSTSSNYSSYSSSSSYTPSYSSHSSSSGNIHSGIGVQVGAFSSKARARAIAQEKAGGEYTAVIKTAKVRGRTIYKAILLGFSSRADAKRAIASGRFGNAFVVTGIHP